MLLWLLSLLLSPVALLLSAPPPSISPGDTAVMYVDDWLGNFVDVEDGENFAAGGDEGENDAADREDEECCTHVEGGEAVTKMLGDDIERKIPAPLSS